jgi:putrescine aminotransferase
MSDYQYDYLFKHVLTDDEEQRILNETFNYYTEHLNPGFLRYKRSVKQDAHGVEWRGEGVFMYDIHGHQFIDCLGGYGVYALGHRHPHVIARVMQTLERIGLYSQELLNPLQAVLAHEIAQRAPGSLQYVYYHCGGAESNDAAIKIARRATGRMLHISFTKSFHGKTFGALSATNRPVLKQPFQPMVYGFRTAPYDNIELLDDYITEEVASVIVEPVQGEGGINVPRTEFLQAVRRRCDEVGALMHIDEVQSGWGRSGKYFCCEHFGVEPDIITLGKALGGGIMPHSALIANPRAFLGTDFTARFPNHTAEDITTHEPGMTKNPWWITNTFAGSQLACAATLATIEVYDNENLLPQCVEKGEYMKRHIGELVERYPGQLREIRGIGLWLGLECQSAAQGTQLADELFHRDVLVAQTINNPSVLRIQPPLIIDREQMDSVLEALAAALQAL